VNVLLVSAHDWFASALQAVLEPEGFVFARARTARVALRDAAQIDPELVIIDEGLPDMDAPGLAASLADGPLRQSVPILVYSPNFWHESEQAAAMRAGAWDIIKEPVRSNLIVAKLRRLLEIKRLIEVTEEGSLSDMATGLFNLAGMMRMLRILGASARRQGVPLSCVVLGPTSAPHANEVDGLRRRAADLFTANVRESDVLGWMTEADLGIVLYDTDAAGVTSMVRRLADSAAEAEVGESLVPISAGIVELTDWPEEEGTERPRFAPMAGRIANLSRVAAAQTALRQAREAGGGIRIAEVS
jgi:PleD family two-component response regulator